MLTRFRQAKAHNDSREACIVGCLSRPLVQCGQRGKTISVASVFMFSKSQQKGSAAFKIVY